MKMLSTATTILNSPSTYMGTVRHYDISLEYEIFAIPGLNSGVQFRSLVEKVKYTDIV